MHYHGKDIIGVILIDSPAPSNHEPLPPAIIEHIVGASESMSQTRRKVIEQFYQHAEMLQNYTLQPHPQPSKMPVVLIQCTESIDTEALCGTKYAWLNGADGRQQNVETWSRLLGESPFKVLDLNCHHFEVFKRMNVCISTCVNVNLVENTNTYSSKMLYLS